MNRPIRIMRGLCNAPIAQLDRAPGYELGGREFESLWAHHIKQRVRRKRLALFFGLFFQGTTQGTTQIKPNYHLPDCGAFQASCREPITTLMFPKPPGRFVQGSAKPDFPVPNSVSCCSSVSGFSPSPRHKPSLDDSAMLPPHLDAADPA
jgi:hypothetical protein